MTTIFSGKRFLDLDENGLFVGRSRLGDFVGEFRKFWVSLQNVLAEFRGLFVALARRKRAERPASSRDSFCPFGSFRRPRSARRTVSSSAKPSDAFDASIPSRTARVFSRSASTVCLRIVLRAPRVVRPY